jgi:formate hydrogenlyase subunit 3/multisubunit Na+/H+ antiporter MnhD subunit
LTAIPGPIVLLALPLLAAGIAYIVRRWTILASLLSAATAGVLAILCLRLPLDRSAFVLGQEVAFGRPVIILGRDLVLDPASQTWLAFIFGLAAFLFLFAWRVCQGRAFFASSLVVLSLYTLTALLQTFSLAVIIYAIAATLTMFVLRSEQSGSVRGAQRYLLVTLLAVPLLLAAAWLTDRSGSSLNSIELAHDSLLPAALGFGLLLAAFPFGTWMPALAAEAPPMASAFVFAIGQAMAMFLALVFLRQSPVISNLPTTASAIQLAGLVMAASGGIMAAVQRDFGRVLGYAALSDLGYVLLAWGAGGSQGLALAMLHGLNRALSITLLAAALAVVRWRANTDDFSRLRGMARQLPLATVGLTVGGLALAGFPFTAGFPTHWAISRAVWNWAQSLSAVAQEAATSADRVSGEQWIWALVIAALVASSAGIIIGVLRGLGAMLGTADREGIARQPIIASLLVLALTAVVIVLGLYPQLFLEQVAVAAQALF